MERNQIIEKSLVSFADYHYGRNNATKANFTKEQFKHKSMKVKDWAAITPTEKL